MLNAVTIGLSESGKSTLSGHFAIQCGAINQYQIIERDAINASQESKKYAWIFDTKREERREGYTIDLASHHIITDNNKYCLTDTPGHQEYIRNTITALSSADIVIIVISITFDLNNGNSLKKITQQIHISNFFGVKNFIVCLNKMDEVNYVEEKYLQMVDTLSNVFHKMKIKLANVPFIPTSGWEGENLTDRSEKMTWYQGKTLIEGLDSLPFPPNREEFIDKPLRFPIKKIFKANEGFIATGVISTGMIEEGDRITIIPGGNHLYGRVESIECYSKKVSKAAAGDCVGVHITDAGNYKDIKRGFVIGHVGPTAPTQVVTFIAKLFISIKEGYEIKRGYTPMIDCHTTHVHCQFTRLIERVLKSKVKEEDPICLKKGDIATVELTPIKPICVESFHSFKSLGRIVIRDYGEIIAFGNIQSINCEKESGTMTKPASSRKH